MALQQSDDVAQADWLVNSLRNDYTVGMLLPQTYEAYTRLLHPIVPRTSQGSRLSRWRDVATQFGGVIHPTVQFSTFASERAGGPCVGSLPADDARALVEELRCFALEECWFCFWIGYGFFSAEAGSLRTPIVHGVLDRSYVLYSGSIDDALELNHWPFHQSPNIWWPASRQWCIATEVDLDSTYVGGPKALVDALLRNSSLEAISVGVNDSITADSDTINTQ